MVTHHTISTPETCNGYCSAPVLQYTAAGIAVHQYYSIQLQVLQCTSTTVYSCRYCSAPVLQYTAAGIAVHQYYSIQLQVLQCTSTTVYSCRYCSAPVLQYTAAGIAVHQYYSIQLQVLQCTSTTVYSCRYCSAPVLQYTAAGICYWPTTNFDLKHYNYSYPILVGQGTTIHRSHFSPSGYRHTNCTIVHLHTHSQGNIAMQMKIRRTARNNYSMLQCTRSYMEEHRYSGTAMQLH